MASFSLVLSPSSLPPFPSLFPSLPPFPSAAVSAAVSAAAADALALLTAATLVPAALLALALYAVYRLVVYPVFLSPLAALPNAHWSSAVSPLWILLVRYRSRENEALLAAHRRHGPVVRLGPSDVSIDHVDHVKTVYGGGFDRTAWYSLFDNYGWVLSFCPSGLLAFWPSGLLAFFAALFCFLFSVFCRPSLSRCAD